MNDLISRQAAIKAIEDLRDCYNGFSDTYDKACIIGALEEVPSVQQKQRWIPVTERLPLYGQDVLAVRTYGDGEKCQEVLMAHIAVWNEGTDEKWWNATNITHWMPLPEPPKEVDDD